MKKLFLGLVLLAMSFAAIGRDVQLLWEPVTNDSRVAGYEVHYGPATGQYDAMVDADGAATATITIQNLDNGSDYFFAVRAKNADASLTSAFSNEVALTPEGALTGPSNLQIR